MPIAYRPDIQILRGLAVIFVALFHLEVSGFGNGFLGVDVFFAISGFLMALLYRHGAPGEFTSVAHVACYPPMASLFLPRFAHRR